MDNKDYIYKAIQLADFRLCADSPAYLDALAAQLVRQVDRTDDLRVDSHFDYVEVSRRGRSLGRCGSENRTMNTIRAIVDSRALEDK